MIQRTNGSGLGIGKPEARVADVYLRSLAVLATSCAYHACIVQ